MPGLAGTLADLKSSRPSRISQETDPMRPISFEENADEVAAELDTRLGQFNDQQAGPRNGLKFVLALRDDNGELVGETLWNTLYVGVLWVRVQHRGNGYGTALMERAEQVAREHGCATSCS